MRNRICIGGGYNTHANPVPCFCQGHFHELKNMLVDKLGKLLSKILVHDSHKRMRLNDCTVFLFLKVNTVPLGIWLTMIWLLIREFLYCLI